MSAMNGYKIIFILVFGVLLGSATPSTAVELYSGGYFKLPVKSMQQQRFNSVVKQQNDFSCGSAAVATLLKEFYAIEISETEVLLQMFKNGDQEKITQEGFSLLDMKKYLRSIGLTANGYRETLANLRNASIPAIVLLNLKGYQHFVVIQKLSENLITVADPSRGVIQYSYSDFQKLWNGIVFVVESDVPKVQRKFRRYNTAQALPTFPAHLALNAATSHRLNYVFPKVAEFR